MLRRPSGRCGHNQEQPRGDEGRHGTRRAAPAVCRSTGPTLSSRFSGSRVSGHLLLSISFSVYGMAGKLPDRGAVGDVLKGFQEVVMDNA